MKTKVNQFWMRGNYKIAKLFLQFDVSLFAFAKANRYLYNFENQF